MSKFISIVVITFNSSEYIDACLGSICGQLSDDVEVLVVDNGSTDATKEIIRSKYERIRLMENDRNYGVCRARNQGIGYLNGEWILVVDSDVVLGESFIREFVEAQKRFADDVGMVQTNILYKDSRTIYSQGIYLSPLRRFYDLNRGRALMESATITDNIIGPCAAAAFYRRCMLQQVKEKTGYFDERFFFLVEDVDLAWRAKKRGWRVVFCPEIQCRHLGNGSRTDALMRQYLSFRNRHLMIIKNENPLGMIAVCIISMPYELIRLIYLLIFNKYIWQKFELIK